jgi:hypothetical protein
MFFLGMNPAIEDAVQLISENQILKAKELLKNFLLNENEVEHLFDAASLLLGLMFNEKKEKEAHQFLFQLFSELKKQNKNFQILELTSRLRSIHSSFKNNQNLFLEFEGWSALQEGKIERAEKAFIKLAKHLVDKKQCDLLEKLLKDLENHFPRNDHFLYFDVKNKIIQGKIEEGVKSIEKMFLYSSKKNKYEFVKNIGLFCFLEIDDSKFVLELIEVLLCNKIKKNKEWQRCLNAIINHQSAFFFFHLSIYLNLMGKKELAKDISEFSFKNYKKEYKNLLKLFPILKNKLEEKKSVEDLIESYSIINEDLTDSKKDQLKIKLKYFEKYPNPSKSEATISLIQQYDPFFVVEENEDVVVDKKNRNHNGQYDNKNIFEELIAQISYFTENKKVDDEKLDSLKKELNSLIEDSFEELSENRLTDYIVMLHTFQFHDLALEMIQKFKVQNTKMDQDIKLFLEIMYLEISINNELKKFYDNLNLLSAINTKLPLSKDEKICFLYLEAETLLNLKREQEALYIFKKINQLEPGYRLSKIRIRQIEKT